MQPLVWRNRVERLARDLRRDQQKLQEQQDHPDRIKSKKERGEEVEEQGVELFPQDEPSCTHRSAAVELTVAADTEGAADTCEGGRIGGQAIQEFEVPPFLLTYRFETRENESLILILINSFTHIIIQ